MSRPRFLAAFAFLTAGLLQAVASADTYKTIHIRNPTGKTADDMDVTFSIATDQDKPQSTNPARPTKPNDAFNAVSGTGTRTLSFTDGSVANNGTADFEVHLDGNLAKGAAAVTGVTFSYPPVGGRPTPNIALTANQMAVSVAGFTNSEYYDFSNRSNGVLHLLGSNPGIQYDLMDLNVYTNLPLANFNFDHLRDDLGTPVFSSADYRVSPGQDGAISLGTILPNTYTIATIGPLVLTDLSSGDVVTFSTPQDYAQNVVPEPNSLVLAALGGLGLLANRRRAADPEPIAPQ
jgi:hypothetical protein